MEVIRLPEGGIRVVPDEPVNTGVVSADPAEVAPVPAVAPVASTNDAGHLDDADHTTMPGSDVDALTALVEPSTADPVPASEPPAEREASRNNYLQLWRAHGLL